MSKHLPDQGPRRHHRRRRLRLLGRLSSGQARLDRHRAARAQAADLGHDLARGRPDRPAARLAEHDAARQIFGRPLRQARGRDRRRHRHAAGRLDHRRADRGAQARDLPAGLAGARLRCRRARDFAGRSQARCTRISTSRRRGRRGASAARRPVRSGQHRHGAGQGRAPARREDRRGRQGHRGPHQKDGRVTGVSWAQGDEQGTIEADIVVNCAGMWARELGAHDRRHHPAARLRAFLPRHRADPRPDAAAGAARAGRMRLLQGGRRQDDARRLRAGRQAVGHGRHSARISASTSCPRTSSISSRSSKWASTACRCWARAGIHTFFNGPESFTPDDRYYLGEAPELRGYWIGAGYNSIGIVSSGGAGMALAQWINDGEPPFDLWEVDIRRAQPFQKNRTLSQGARHRDARPALCRPFPLPPDGDARAACAARRCTSI